MKKLILKQDLYANIHSIQSSVQDIEIKFKGDTVYAVVSSHYYNAAYTTHKTEKSAYLQSVKLTKLKFCHEIIDFKGSTYTIDVDTQGLCVFDIQKYL